MRRFSSCKKMASPREVFNVSGPVHLTSIHWNCPHTQRAVVASLVQGVSVSERDRIYNRKGLEACAPAWWQFFHFELIELLIDDADSSIFGAIYEYKDQRPTNVNAPKYVIAFRGTILKKKSFLKDIVLDIKIIRNCLHETPRFKIAMQAVQTIVAASGPRHLWLAGHSLGAAMATIAGRNMVKMSINLKTFLFNPPFLSVPIERIKDKNVKQGLRIAGNLITAGLTVAVKGRHHNSDSFTLLASWVPNIFVNISDDICSAYVGYFEHRQVMEDKGIGGIGKLATENSVRGLLSTAFGKKSEPMHLIPSANLIVNKNSSPDFKTAHGIHQWFKPASNFQVKQYIYS